MQATFRGKLGKGVTFQSAYTLSKAMNNTVIYNDQNRLDLSNGRAASTAHIVSSLTSMLNSRFRNWPWLAT